MKKLISILSAVMLLFSLCACAQDLNHGGAAKAEGKEETDSFSEAEGVSINEFETTDEYSEIYEVTEPTTAYSTTKTTKKSSDTPSVSPDRFGTWDYDDNPEMFPQVRQITRDTPGHKGVNLREKPSSKSGLIMVIPEGTEVLLRDEMASSDSYWKVSVKADGKEYTGYVMERYVSSFSGADFSYRVSYNTPDHAGLVLRSDASSKSEKIIVVPEGTDVRVWNDMDDENYWQVDVFYNGKIYSGFILGKYVEYK